MRPRRPLERVPVALLTRVTVAIWLAVGVGLTATVAAYGVGVGRDNQRSVQAAPLKPVSTATKTDPTKQAAVVPSATSVPSATAAPSAAAVPSATAQPTQTPVPTVAHPTPAGTPAPTLTAAQLQQYKPNELGQIMVLMFHGIDYTGSEYSTTPEEFQSDLDWLYKNDFYVIPIHDYITDQIRAPAGKRPVVLTFDDGPVNQFNYLVDAKGNKTIDPKCAIGILENFYAKHPDFGRGGVFAILPLAPFAWPDADSQIPYEQEKVQFLVDHGYEIANHTVDHTDLKQATNDEIKSELAGAVDMMRKFSPKAQMEVIAMPFGNYPPGGDTTLLEGFDYKGQHYGAKGALMVGANPSPSPDDTDFDPMWIPRIRATTEILPQWFKFVEDNPGIMYVSDGNPSTVTIPREVAPALAGKLDDSKTAGKTVVRY